MFGSLASDLRYAFRTLGRNPGFASVSILALALGIGANSAIFTVVNSVLLDPMRLYRSDRLVVVRERNLPLGFPEFSLSPGNYRSFRDEAHSFSGIAVAANGDSNLSRPGAEAVRVHGNSVTNNFFQVLGEQPVLGRTFTPEESELGKEHEVILSYALWQGKFAGSRGVLGTSVNLSGVSYQVVGVMPPDFNFPGHADFWRPLAMKEADWRQRGGHYLFGIGRLRDGATLAAAQTELNQISHRLQQEFPASNAGWDTRLFDLRERTVGKIRPAMLTLLAAVGFVLLIACVNLANLLLSRASARRREIGIRGALGAGKGRLVGQLLTESLVLAGIGTSVGLLLAKLATRLMITIDPAVLPRANEISLDLRAVLVTAAIGVLTGILFGLAPALQMARADINSALRDGGRGNSVGFRRGNLRSLLVTGEVALAVLLLSGAVLMMRSFYRLQAVDPGFDATNVLTFRTFLPAATYAKDPQISGFYDRVLTKLRALPGVTSVGAASLFPLSSSDSWLEFNKVGKPPKPPGQETSAMYQGVTPGYFAAMKIPLKTGRLLRDSDAPPEPPVVVISEALAKKYFPGENPVGQRIDFGLKPAEIVGIVGNVRHAVLDGDPPATIYVPQSQDASRGLYFAVRTASAPESLIPAVRAAVHELDAEVPLDGVGTVSNLVDTSLSQQRLTVLLLGIFAGLALVLAMIGIYGVLAYAVTQAAPEIGIRVALGASRTDVLRLVVSYGGILILTGVITGTAAALVVGRALSTQLYEVKATDPATYGLVGITLAVTGLVACLIPAWRAMRVDPLDSLRSN